MIDTSFHNQRIAVLNAAGGELRQVSPADLHVYDFDWSPDGQSFVVTDPAAYEKSSPMHFIKNVKTPTLVIVGERDAECPAPQSYEFWHALRTLNVPTQLIVYPGEGHMFIKPEHQRDRLDQTLGWFDKYLAK